MAVQIVVAALPLIKEFITAGASYLAAREHEKTERERIAAQLEACLTTINKNHEIFLQALENNHAEIMEAYKLANDLLKDSECRKNLALVAQVLEFVKTTHTSSNSSLSAMVSSIAANQIHRIG